MRERGERERGQEYSRAALDPKGHSIGGWVCCSL